MRKNSFFIEPVQVKKVLKIETEETVKKVVNKEIIHYKFAAKGLQKIVGKALLRTPIIGIGLGCLMELPAIIINLRNFAINA